MTESKANIIKNQVVSMEYTEDGRPLRQNRSFVRRQGRLTLGQQSALEHYWVEYGVDFSAQLISFPQLFQRQAPVTLEIGFGMGQSLVKMAQMQPERNFLGVEVHLPGVGACIAAAQKAGIKNLRLICHDAVEVLTKMIADDSLDCVQLFFPDPWHKNRHHKRRIVQTEFAQLIRQKLQLGSHFHMATDWQDYAIQMLQVMREIKEYKNCDANNEFIPRPAERPLTKFEQRGLQLGHGVWDLMFERIK